MIVTCPDCATRYLVDPGALGASGRVVRCANCAHTWHQTPPEDVPRRIELPPLDAEPTEGSETRIQLPAVAQRPRPALRYIVGWLVMLVILVGIGAGLFLERGRIVATWPVVAGLYQAIGLPVTPAEKIFETRNVQTQRVTENDLPTIVVTGEVVNLSPMTRAAPKVKVSLNDVNDHELQAWTVPLTEDRLLPGQSVPFRTSIAQPNAAAVAVSVAIVGGG